MTNHEQTGQSSPEALSSNAVGLLDLQKVEAWRTKQYGILSGLREAASDIRDTSYVETFNQSIDEQLNDFLAQQGIEQDDSHYAEIRELYRSASINLVSNNEWFASPANRGVQGDQSHSGRDEFDERIAGLLESHGIDAAANPDPTDPDTPPVAELEALQSEAILENARFDVNKSRDSWAKAASKRAGSGIRRFYKSKKHKNLETDYHASVQELGKLELQSILEDDSVSAQDKNVAVISFLFDEQKKLREKTLENLKSTKVSKFVEWMNKGNVATRIAKGVGIGALAGVTGAFLAGAAGAGIVAAGAVAGSRFVKGYASKDRHRGSHIPNKLDDVNVQNSEDTKLVLEHLASSTSTDLLGSASNKVNSFFEDDIKDEQNQRLKSLGMGAVSVVVGAGLGYGVHAGAEWMSGKDLNFDAIEKTKNFLQGNGFTAEEMGKVPGGPGTKAEVGEWGYNNDFDGDGVVNGQDVAPRNPDIGAVDFTEITRDARWIEHGEGGFETLKELGVPEEKWEAVWADAGQHFAEDGKTYVMDDGRYGWSEPGRLTNSDITELVKAARRQGVALDFTLAA